MNYIDVLVKIPVKVRYRADNPADLEDAYSMAEEAINELFEEFRKIVKSKHPDMEMSDVDTMDMDYDERTYDPYPKEDPNQVVKDLGEWRSAS